MGRIVALIVAVYALGFLLTFGHAYHQESMRFSYIGEKTYRVDPAARSVGTMIVALFWPLYWAVHVMEPAAQPAQGVGE